MAKVTLSSGKLLEGLALQELFFEIGQHTRFPVVENLRMQRRRDRGVVCAMGTV
jgi:hypothetical protein